MWRLVVDSIEVDPDCDQYAAEPTRGHWVLVTMRVETSDLYRPARDGYGPSYFDFGTIGPAGVSEAPMSSYSPCRAATDLPVELRPVAKYQGTVGVDTGNTEGQLVFADFAAWNYPS